jgi:hypothetical protein
MKKLDFLAVGGIFSGPTTAMFNFFIGILLDWLALSVFVLVGTYLFQNHFYENWNFGKSVPDEDKFQFAFVLFGTIGICLATLVHFQTGVSTWPQQIFVLNFVLMCIIVLKFFRGADIGIGITNHNANDKEISFNIPIEKVVMVPLLVVILVIRLVFHSDLSYYGIVGMTAVIDWGFLACGFGAGLIWIRSQLIEAQAENDQTDDATDGMP